MLVILLIYEEPYLYEMVYPVNSKITTLLFFVLLILLRVKEIRDAGLPNMLLWNFRLMMELLVLSVPFLKDYRECSPTTLMQHCGLLLEFS
jgi:hypothetical protein